MGVGVALVALGFFFIQYGTSGTFVEIQQTESITGGKVSEGALKIIEGNVSVLREELQNDFYKTLKRYKWATDTAAPGKQNPFE